jgi:diguanylate cyclase (GGDEF)-like protein
MTTMTTAKTIQPLFKDAGAVAGDSTAVLMADPGNLGRALRITALLQTTLDAARLIDIFSRELNGAVPHDSIRYVNPESNIEVAYGRSGRHSCSYRLRLEEQSLGQLSLTRRERFANEELSLLEHLLCSLIHPLHNALAYQRAIEEARKDPLTGVYNRGMFELLLRREVGLARRHQIPFSLIFADIDHFKTVNDVLGHACGDTVLKNFIACITECIRSTDILARYGGDEFIVLLNNTPIEGARRLAERIRRRVERSAVLANPGGGLRVTASLGVAALEPETEVEALLARADRALAAAKQSGRNVVCG